MFISTRGGKEISSYQAILDGLAKDGGLYVKKDIEFFSLNELNKLKDLKYQDLAIEIFKRYFDGFSEEKLKKIVTEAYSSQFDIESIVKVKKCTDCFFLELYHGPTLAFKDVALQALPLLMKESKEIAGLKEKRSIILTATSGDTGSAALKGFSLDENTKMIVLYPTKGVSRIQEQQMLSLESNRLFVRAIEGNFDDAQRIVKKVFNDTNLKKNLKYPISSANSINIGRLIPQIVYYFYSYFELVNNKEIQLGEKVNFVVPTGNFGNILACFLSEKMGLPINKLICASNCNNVLSDFFNKKVYDRNRDFIKTSSPSMDILISSNLERLLYYGTYDCNYVKEWMSELDKKGSYEVYSMLDKTIDAFYANYSNEDETREAIKEIYRKDNYLIDPHTAVAYSVFNKYKKETKDNTKTIIASTAHPYKFPFAVYEAISNQNNDNWNEFDIISKLEKETDLKESEMIKALRQDFKKTIWKKESAYNNMCQLLSELNNE